VKAWRTQQERKFETIFTQHIRTRCGHQVLTRKCGAARCNHAGNVSQSQCIVAAASLQHLIRRIALQEFTQEETASLLALPLRTVHRRYADALDELTEIFLERKLLEPSKAGQEAGTIL